MRRFFGAILIGLGALLLVAAGGLALFVAPAVTKLPYDMRPCPAKNPPAGCLKPSVAEAKDATFLQISKAGVKINKADLRSTTEVIPQAKTTADEQSKNRLTDASVVWDVYSTVKRIDDGAVISASSTELALDRASGEAVTGWKGQWISESENDKDTSITYKGEVYKFPFSTEKKDYPYWDSDTRTAPTAKFTSVESIEGVQTYHFVQTIPEATVAVADSSLAVLVATFAPTAKSGQVTYSNTREVWVDPVTGSFIKVREQPHQTFTPNVGAPTVLLNADFVYTADTIKNSAQSAKDNGFQLSLVKLYLPVGAGLIGAILLIWGLLLLRTRGAAGTAGGATAGGGTDGGGTGGTLDAELPAARHSLRGETENSTAWSN